MKATYLRDKTIYYKVSLFGQKNFYRVVSIEITALFPFSYRIEENLVDNLEHLYNFEIISQELFNKVIKQIESTLNGF